VLPAPDTVRAPPHFQKEKNVERTIVITGSSSGIGRATALHFAARGWRVVATMRDVSRSPFGNVPGISVVALDVTRPDSIAAAVKAVAGIAPRVDVLLNNAGYALRGVLEGYTREQIETQLRTNVIGLIDVIRAFLPGMRAQGAGTIVNIASMGGRIGFPIYTLYATTKFAVEGFTEALMYELAPLGIKVRLIEPGVIRTDFYSRSMDKVDESSPPEYSGFLSRALDRQKTLSNGGSSPETAARAIYRAATSRGSRLRFSIGSDARLVLVLRSVLPFRLFRAVFRRFMVG
jgi:NAD(P)-dependent dehydrogenase (short-subunit alcohol dehydrogenase family)